MSLYIRKDKLFYEQVTRLMGPIVLQNVITSTLGMMDTFMVGLLGEQQMAALTLANIPIFVLQLLFFGVQSGASVLISQYWGKGKLDEIQQVTGVGTAVVSAVSFGVALMLFFIPIQFLTLFGNDPTVVSLAAEYGKIIGFAYFLNGFTMIYIATYRSIGKPELGMMMLGISMVINVFLNWVFIFGNLGAPALGVQGAAIGTLFARSSEILVMAIHVTLLKNKPDKFRLDIRKMMAPSREIVTKFFYCSCPIILNETLWGMGTMVFPTIMGHMDNSVEILAAYTIIGNLEKLVMVASFGLAASSAILVGREIGSGRDQQEVHRTGVTLVLLGVLCGILSALTMWLLGAVILPPVLAPLFKLSVSTTKIAKVMAYCLAGSAVLRTVNCVMVVGVLRGGGDVKKSAMIDIIPLWCVAVPLAILLGGVLKLDVVWVYVAMAMEHVVKVFFGTHRISTTAWIQDLTISKKL